MRLSKLRLLAYCLLSTLLLMGCGQEEQQAAATPTGASSLPVATTTPPADAQSTAPRPTTAAASLSNVEITDAMSVGLALVAEGLTAPMLLSEPPDASGLLFVVDRVGLVRVIDRAGTLLPQPFLDVRNRLVTFREEDDERGLMSMAFHPEYRENGRFYVYYTAPPRDLAPEGWDHTGYLVEFQRSPGEPPRANSASERVLLTIDHPQGNHIAGMLAFGPDGFLYLSLGDGGGTNDEAGNGQDITQNLLGSVLRLDVDGAEPYGIPEDNPFVGQEGDAFSEIYAFGFHHPYRFSFDREEGTLLLSDSAEARYEEINLIERGGNYGWNIREGMLCFSPDGAGTPDDSCPTVDVAGRALLEPLVTYPQEEGGTRVVGGYIYRGSALPELEGAYIFGSWSRTAAAPRGVLLVISRLVSADGASPPQRLTVRGATDGDLGAYLLGFGEDQAGELYVLTSEESAPTGATGRVFRLVPAEEDAQEAATATATATVARPAATSTPTTAIQATSTRVPATNTPVPATSTRVPPTNTPVLATAAPTLTAPPATATSAPTLTPTITAPSATPAIAPSPQPPTATPGEAPSATPTMTAPIAPATPTPTVGVEPPTPTVTPTVQVAMQARTQGLPLEARHPSNREVIKLH